MKNYEEIKLQNDYLHRVVQAQEITNELLQISLVEPSLSKMLELSIDKIVSAPLFSFKSKGAIFLLEDEPEVLILKAQRGLPDYLLKECARTPFGKCLCGKAAQNKKMVYADCVDARHDIGYPGMPPHGHYCVPMLIGEKLIGVITLYVEEGHQFDSKEHDFLQTISDVLSGTIQRREMEIAIKQSQLKLLQSGKLVAVGQLAAGIAHEINNPIGFISSNLFSFERYVKTMMDIITMTDSLIDSLMHKNLRVAKDTINNIRKVEQNEDMEFISKDLKSLIEDSQLGVERIKKIVLDLNAFSSEKKDIIEEIDLKQVLEGALKIIKNEIIHNIEIETQFNDVPRIKGDSQKIGQVFINILINATQAMPDKGKITIKLFSAGDYIYTSIADTGCGIPETNLDDIFNPFFTTKPVGQGTGLGLSVCHDIISSIGGEIMVESIVNKGTIFTIKIPCK
ncbi:MAG: ATP-binding protein [Desulfobacteraceae bacterium]|jgi:signal transduction histidine kinase